MDHNSQMNKALQQLIQMEQQYALERNGKLRSPYEAYAVMKEEFEELLEHTEEVHVVHEAYWKALRKRDEQAVLDTLAQTLQDDALYVARAALKLIAVANLALECESTQSRKSENTTTNGGNNNDVR